MGHERRRAEVAHLRGARVEQEDCGQGQREQRYLVADERDCLAGPEEPELALPKEVHAGGMTVSGRITPPPA
jgi:hypothetical protein